MKNEIVLYQANELSRRIDVRVESETVWLTIDQMSELFQKSRSTINEHILNIYKEKELDKGTTKRKIGNSDFSTKPTNFYNLDVIISVGYRVKSKQGTQFRIWANGILKEYLLKGYSISNRVFRIEEDVYSLKQRVDEIDLQISADKLPKQEIFFDGQIFDAYKFVSDLFRTAEKSIILADNYIDDTVLVHLTKLKEGVQIKIITKSVSVLYAVNIVKKHLTFINL